MGVRGVREYFQDELQYFNLIEKTARDVLTNLGFKEFQSSILEELSIFVRSQGEASDIIVNKEMFFINDDENKIVLRPEFTPQIARTYVEKGFGINNPIWKLFYIGPCFRRERPQKGRQREFYQMGIETLGDKNIMYTFEIFLALKVIFEKLDIKDYKLNINSLGCFEKCRKDYINYMKTELEVNISKLCSICKERFIKNPLRILDCKNTFCKDFLKNELDPIGNFLCDNCKKDYNDILDLLTKNGIAYIQNDYLVRGFDYYTGIVFEYTHASLGAQDTFCGGGRYDNLLKSFGEKSVEGGVGCGLGIERTILILQQSNTKIIDKANPKVYIAFTDSALMRKNSALLEKLIKNSFSVFSDYSKPSLKAHFKRAQSVNADYVLIIGETEDTKGMISVKNLKKGTQEEVVKDNIIEYLRSKIIN